jgi:hypothetical protein
VTASWQGIRTGRAIPCHDEWQGAFGTPMLPGSDTVISNISALGTDIANVY